MSNFHPRALSVFGAVDCGSNAIRAGVALPDPTGGFRLLERRRYPVRLGHDAFRTGLIGPRAWDGAVEAFQEIREFFGEYSVSAYRACATSALRNADNGLQLRRSILANTGLELELIHGEREALLTATSVLDRFAPSSPPQVIADLGGGSLELSFLRQGSRLSGGVLPLGTVRLSQELGYESLPERDVLALQRQIREHLDEAFPVQPAPSQVAICGGNAKALARIFPGPRTSGMRTIDCSLLRSGMRELTALNAQERMERFSLRRDRAEVIGLAAVVISTLAQWTRCENLVSPGVGVLDGLLAELAREPSTDIGLVSLAH